MSNEKQQLLVTDFLKQAEEEDERLYLELSKLDDEGRTNLVGGLRKAMAVAGHDTLKELQKAELVLAAGTGAPGRGVERRGLT